MQKTLEDTLRLDVRKLSKGGCFKRSSQGAIRWGVSGVNHLRFRYCKSYSLFKIFYAIGGESVKQQKCQSICVDQTSCHIGGHRNWFRCPLCFNRVALLYFHGSTFKCRVCSSLPYRSTLESYAWRLIAKKHKLGEEIFQNYSNVQVERKKKGIHCKTFKKKLSKFRSLDMAIEDALFTDILGSSLMSRRNESFSNKKV